EQERDAARAKVAEAEAARQEATRLRAELRRANEQLEAAQKEIDRRGKLTAETEAERVKADAERHDRAVRVEELGTALREARELAEARGAEVLAARRACDEIAAELDARQTDLAGRERRVADLEKEVTRLVGELAAARGALDDVTVGGQDDVVAKLEAQLHEREEALSRADEQVREFSGRAQELEHAVSEAQTEAARGTAIAGGG